MTEHTGRASKKQRMTCQIEGEDKECHITNNIAIVSSTHLPPNGICIDLSYSSREVKGCGIAAILNFAAPLIRLSDIITLGLLVSLLPFFFSSVSSSTFFSSLFLTFKIFALTPVAPGPAQSPHPALTAQQVIVIVRVYV